MPPPLLVRCDVGELLLFCFCFWVAMNAGRWWLFLTDRERWDRERQRDHEARMENKRMAGGVLGFFRRLLGG